MESLTKEIESLNIETVREQLRELAREAHVASSRAAKCEGIVAELSDRIKDTTNELNNNIYRLADEQYRNKLIDMKVFNPPHFTPFIFALSMEASLELC